MPRFLTQEWVDELVAGLNASDEAAVAAASLTLHQVVTGVNGESVEYWTTFDGGHVTGGLGPPPSEPDVTLTQDLDTARALSRGELNAQAAFMQGKLKVTGNMGKLLQEQAAIGALATAMQKVQTD